MVSWAVSCLANKKNLVVSQIAKILTWKLHRFCFFRWPVKVTSPGKSHFPEKSNILIDQFAPALHSLTYKGKSFI